MQRNLNVFLENNAKRKTTMNKYLIFTLVIVMIIQASCNQPPPAKQKNHLPVYIKVEKAARTDLSDSVVIFGEIRLRYDAYLASQFDGRLTGFSLLNGDEVKEGQKIGVVVPPMREALNQAMDDMNEEQRKLVADEIKEIPLYCPISGIVLEVAQNNGDVVQKGETIVHIADLSRLDIYGDLPLAYMPLVKQLKKVKVSFPDYPHSPLLLPVASFSGKVDAGKQTVNIRLGLNNPQREFRPGMLVQLSFPDKVHKNALVVPRRALLEEEGIYSVYVLKGNKVEKRNVTIGIKQDDFVEIVSGLKEGEEVATEKAYSLTDGMEVQVK
jgi:multidrug efflux pump subunit AcrA (membrane-fusion protein)